MGIQMIGIDHIKAPVDIRALFCFTKKNAAISMAKMKIKKYIKGIVILSTCNRMELWISSDEDNYISIFNLLQELKDKDLKQYQKYFVERSGKEAAIHLFSLSCGLKSQILGEDQIITQVKDALSLSRENYCTDNVLETLFRMAITAAKKVKTEISLTVASNSIIHQAIKSLLKGGYEIKGKHCMVIGNGEMGKLSATALIEAGANVTVTVRQYHSGMVEIPAGCQRINYGDRMEYFKLCDLVVSATSSPNYTLKKCYVEEANISHPMVLIDLAVPRDIEPEIGDFKNILLYDIDSFHIEMQTEQVKKNIEKANKILDTQLEEFFSWYECRDIIPKIQQIKESAITDLDIRVQKIIKNVSIESEKKEYLNSAIEYAAEKVVNKMIFGLRDTVSQEVFRACVEGLQKVYQID